MKHATPFSTGRLPRQRGVTLIEALVALMVMSFGMVALVGLLANLRRGGDVAKQRSEAMRIAQADLASLRAFADLKRPNGSTTPDYDTDLAVSELAWNAAVANGNTTFTVTRKVTPVINVGAEPQARTVDVTVDWLDRAGEQGKLRLSSVISRTDPAFSGAAAITPPVIGLRTMSGRNPAIPAGAADLPDQRSVYRPSPSTTTVLVFNRLTGVITSICTVPVDTPVSSLTAADVAGCTSTTAYFLSGTIRFSNTNPANPKAPEALALPLVSATVDLTESKFSIKRGGRDELAPNRGYTGTPQCFSDAPTGIDANRSFINYGCIIYPNTQTTPNWWGRVLLTGLSLGTQSGQSRVCRYSADYNGNGYTLLANAPSGFAYLPNGGGRAIYFRIDNEEHPETYFGVTYSLARQNFLVVRGDVPCPTAPAPNPAAGVFVDYSTIQIQP